MSCPLKFEEPIKLSVVVSDLFGVSGRAMMAALIDGERDPAVLAGLACGSMRSKTGRLREALTGRFTDHHAFLLSRMLARVDAITADIATVQDRIEVQIAPFAQAVARLDEIPGVGVTAAQAIIAEIGLDMSRVPDPGAPGVVGPLRAGGQRVSRSGKKGNAGTRHGIRYLARVLGEAAVSASRTDTFLGERYRRIARRRGKKGAIVAVGRSFLTIVWLLLSDDDAHFIDLGSYYYYDSRTNATRRVRNHVRELQALGYTVTLNPAA